MKNELLEETISELKDIAKTDGMENSVSVKLEELIYKLEGFDLAGEKKGSKEILKELGEHLLKALIKTAPLIIDEIMNSN